jgi:LAS superfamily LD-carboxypeptidase LdcB
VSATHILTAAACLLDVTHLYAIAGYRKYVRTEHLEEDECTKNRKQRVLKTCTPKGTLMSYIHTTQALSPKG